MARRVASEIFRRATTQRALRETYEKHVRLGNAIGRDGEKPSRTQARLGELVPKLQSDMRRGSHRFTAYREHLISKGANKPPRAISIPTARDRIVHKAVAKVLDELFSETSPEVAQAKISRLKENLNSGEYDYFIRLDLAEFYPSIDHEHLRALLSKRTRSSALRTIIIDAIQTPTLSDTARAGGERNDRGVPQGLSISNTLAEIAMLPLDNEMRARSELCYLRYVDDILILCRQGDADSALAIVQEHATAANLQIHPFDVPDSKSTRGAISQEFDYLGYVISDGKTGVRGTSVRKIESSLARVITKYRHVLSRDPQNPTWQAICADVCEWRLNLVITGCVFENSRRGWLAYFSQTDDLAMLRRLDITVGRLVARVGLSETFGPKKFSKAIWQLKKSRIGAREYVPNFDKFSDAERRQVLVTKFGIRPARIAAMDDDEVMALFRAKIRRIVVDLEKDVTAMS